MFADPMVAATNRELGVAAILRALALLLEVEKALKVMGAGVRGNGGRRPSAPMVDEPTVLDKWRSAMRKVRTESCGTTGGGERLTRISVSSSPLV